MSQPVKVGGESIYTPDAKKPGTDRSYRFEIFYSPGDESSTPFFAKVPQIFQTTLNIKDRVHAKTESAVRDEIKRLGREMSKACLVETKVLAIRTIGADKVVRNPGHPGLVVNDPGYEADLDAMLEVGFDFVIAWRREAGANTNYVSARRGNRGFQMGHDYVSDGTEVFHLCGVSGQPTYDGGPNWKFVDWTPEREQVAREIRSLLFKLKAMLKEHFGSNETAAMLLDTGVGRLMLNPPTTT